jgi:restriction system protein
MALKEWPQRYKLRPWQLEFAQKYLEQHKPMSLLAAAPGTGKTITALYTAHLMLEKGNSDSLIVLNDVRALKAQWEHVTTEVGFNLSDDINQYHRTEHDGLNITTQSLKSGESIQKLLDLAKESNYFGIVDESHRINKTINEVVDKFLRVNNKNRFLFIGGNTALTQDTFDEQFRFNSEYIFQDSIIKLPETKIEIAHFSPSFSVLQRILHKHVEIEDLNWREFEKLISELLTKDGYKVELMKGTKDGGVDVVAVKDMGEAGFFKTLWQAKKKSKDNKVGLSVIRELADTRNEFKASKGIIVTSTYLTRGALARIKRDKYILGKVDRNDLNEWIQKTLFRQDS